MKRCITVILALLLIFSLNIVAAMAGEGAGLLAKYHLTELSENIGARAQGSMQEKAAADYVFGVFTEIGYPCTTEIFKIADENGAKLDSYNVIAYKKGILPQELIVCAHIDSKAAVGRGADDNASGVAVMLEAAERLKDYQTPYTIRFIAFGSEESLFEGSGAEKGASHYVEMMGDAAIKNTIGVVNLDSLIAGDIMYAHGEKTNGAVLRDTAIVIAKKMDYDLEIQTGANEMYPAGTTGDWGDHAQFAAVGIPFVNFEATNWHLGSLDGYQQVDEKYGVNGEIWHTKYDNMTDIEKMFPGRIDEHLQAWSDILTELLAEYGDNIVSGQTVNNDR